MQINAFAKSAFLQQAFHVFFLLFICYSAMMQIKNAVFLKLFIYWLICFDSKKGIST